MIRSRITVNRSQLVEKASGFSFANCDPRSVIRDLRSVICDL